MSPHPTDDTTTDWTVEDLRNLRDDPAGTDLVAVPAWTQSEWDRRQVRQLQATEQALGQLADGRGTPASVLVRESLLTLGYQRAAHDHMAATALEDAHSIYAAMWDDNTSRNNRLRVNVPLVDTGEPIVPSRVIQPGRRHKPPRGPGGRFVKGGAS